MLITDGKKWHYLAVESLSALLRGITSNNNRAFYCTKCLHSFRRDNKLENNYNVYGNHYYYVEMLKGNNKILKYDPQRKFYESCIYCLR